MGEGRSLICGCAPACEEVQGTFALIISGRGFDSIVSAGMVGSFLESECVSCGACVQTCPTGSLLQKTAQQPAHNAAGARGGGIRR
jgi:formate dehydrogenase major subunit